MTDKPELLGNPENQTNYMQVIQSPLQSPSIGKLAEALSKAQGEMEGAKKDSTNPFFKSKYADLHAVWEAVREALSKNGLAVVQATGTVSDRLDVVTTLIHSSGEWMRSYTPVINIKKDAQGMGSAITYARRYSLAAIAGIAQMDDDGNAAVAPPPVIKMDQKVKKQVFDQSVECLANGDENGLKEIWNEFNTDEKAVLWGLFNSEQRKSMKELMK